VDGEIGRQGERIWNSYHPPFEVRVYHFDDVELGDGPVFVIAEKGEGRPQASAKGVADLGRIGTDDGEFTVVDPELVL
jgi:hypothetical protein